MKWATRLINANACFGNSARDLEALADATEGHDHVAEKAVGYIARADAGPDPFRRRQTIASGQNGTNRSPYRSEGADHAGHAWGA
jgi:hypothetical protein